MAEPYRGPTPEQLEEADRFAKQFGLDSPVWIGDLPKAPGMPVPPLEVIQERTGTFDEEFEEIQALPEIES